MTNPIRIKCSKSYPPQEEPVNVRWTALAKRIWRKVCEAREAIKQADSERWHWWELVILMTVVLALIFAVFHTAEAQIVRGMV